MSGIPKPEAGSRFSGPELMLIVREAASAARHKLPLPGLAEVRARVAGRRAERYLVGTEIRVLTMTQAAFVLCRSKAYVRALVQDGRLSGELIPAIESPSGYTHWRIPVGEVRALAVVVDAEGTS